MRPARIATLAVAAALVLVGCGQPAEDDGILRVSLASAQTRAAETARVAMSATMEMLGDPELAGLGRMQMSGEGAFDLREFRGHLEMTMPAMPGMPAGASVESIYDGTVVYMRMPMLGNEGWLRFDMDMLADEFGLQDLLGQQAPGTDPSAMLEFFHGAKNVEEIGVESVRDAVTTRYRATVDLRDALSEAPAEAQASLENLLGQLGGSEFPVEVWLDPDGRVRKIAYDMEMNLAEEIGMRMTSVIEFFDFGVDVTVTPPPAHQVTDITTEMLGQFQSP